MINIGYTNYIIMLLILTGLLILYVDVKAYDREKKKKEKKTAIVIGAVNIFGGVSLMLVNWLSNQWFW